MSTIKEIVCNHRILLGLPIPVSRVSARQLHALVLMGLLSG